MGYATHELNPDIEINPTGLLRHIAKVRGFTEEDIEYLYELANRLIPTLGPDAQVAAETIRNNRTFLRKADLKGVPKRERTHIIYNAIASYLIEERTGTRYKNFPFLPNLPLGTFTGM